jgi:hypothetical protein
MTNVQLYLAIGLPVVVNTLALGFVFIALNQRLTDLRESLIALWRAELHRVEEVIDARLKHLEEHPQ